MIFFKDPEGVVYETCLPVAARCHERHIPAVGDCGNKLLGFAVAVAEVLRSRVAAYEKWVVGFHVQDYTITSIGATKFSRLKFRRAMDRKKNCGDRPWRDGNSGGLQVDF